jgi:NADH-quinone oxidoreductase subunit G
MAEQKLVKFKLNERELEVPAGTLVIEAARRQGIEVPSFCYYPGLSLQAACRMCLVEVEKAPKLQTACTLVAMDGMVVRTDTEQVRQARKTVLEFLLTNHPLDCPVCDKGGECELQDMVFRYGADTSRFVEEKIHQPEEQWSPVVYYDGPRCILCFRCVRVCDEGMDVKALGVGQRGVHSVIIPNRGDHLECEECGMCIDICPVGALTSGTYRYKTRPWEMKYVGTVCTHCSNGCKTTLSVRNNEILRANNRDLSGINKDFLCIKGRFGFDFLNHAQRLKLPQVRREGKLLPASWEESLGEAARRLAEIRAKHGAEAIGFIGSNRTSNEESYLLQRIARAQIGTNNIDHHRTADYAGLAAALGNDAPTALCSVEQLASAKAFLLIGNDPTEQNPLVAWQVRTAIRNGGARLYMINAERVKLARKAKHFIETGPGGEEAVLRYLATGMGELDAELTVEVMTLKAALEKESDLVILFGAAIRGARIADLLALGAQLPGQERYMALGDYSNSRGASDMGLLPDFLPGYAHVDSAKERERFGKLWSAELPEKPGLVAREMMSAAASGKLKALVVVGANPVKTFGAILSKLELLVALELFPTETTEQAHIVLPAASAYEKDGTVTNTAGEVQRLHRAVETMGPRADFDILRILSHQLAQAGVGKAAHVRSPEAVFEEIRANVRGYGVATASLLTGGAELAATMLSRNGHRPYDVPADAVFSSRDTLFTSGTLGRFCTMVSSVPEAKAAEAETAGATK